MGSTMERSGKNILIVEDEPMIAMLLEDMLVDLGYDVAGVASSLSQGLELVEREGFDAAIIDLQLGDQDSLPIAARLNQKGIPFAFATGYGAATSTKDAPIISKPYRHDDIGKALLALLS